MRGERLLTRKEYACVAARLCRNGQLRGSEIYQFHNTVRGLDMLELLGRCLQLELVVSTDVTLIGETLAQHFCEDGYSFGLYTLFKYAGDKICRGNAERYACLAVDEAARELWLNVHSYEDREFHTVRLMHLKNRNDANLITYLLAIGQNGGRIRSYSTREAHCWSTEEQTGQTANPC